MIDAPGKNGVRTDECVGKVHNSVFDLQRQQLQLESTTGTTQLIDLTRTNENILSLLLADDLSYVELLYDLTASQFDPLARFSGDRELIFSIGAEEELATITPGGVVRFNDAAHLSQLDDVDLLTIRLYQNNDSANILWEYSLAGGVFAYYKLPHVERLLKKTKDSPLDNKEFRILGGTRSRFEYYPEPDEGNITHYQWSFTPAGQFKKDFKHDALVVVDTNMDTVYWEPNEWKTDHNVSGNLRITLSDGTVKNKTFKVTTRELKPVSGDEMEGSDVVMLEEVLWQLGISPQKGSPGSEGARINSNRGAPSNQHTQTCDGNSADKRNVFYTGWASCAGSQVSLEAMVRRFQARHNATSASRGGNKVKQALLNGASAQIDNATLSDLKQDWTSYAKAYQEFASSSVIPSDDPRMATWVDEAVAIWSNGNGTRVPANTYTNDTHDDIVTLSGLTPNNLNNRNAFLRNWITKESTHHWGSNRRNYQSTPYRMAEGGADEHGSLSFSQLLYGHRYGLTPCAVHDAAKLNLYHPGDNVKTFVLHTASDNVAGAGQTKCKGLIYRGFVDQNLDKTFVSDTGTINNKNGNVNDLVGYRHNNGGVTVIPASEDNYDVLSKAVMGYNSGETYADNYSWSKFIKYKEYQANSNRNTGKICHSCRYSIEVRETIFKDNLRTFIWAGERQPATLTDGSVNPQAGEPVWCFAFGEKEWVEGKKFNLVQKAAIGDALTPGVGRVNCTTGVTL